MGIDETIRLECAPNFRDLGGYETGDGAKVARRRIYRSEAVTRPTAADLATLGGLGIKLVCDVRGAAERAAAPGRWPDSPAPDMLHLDIDMDLRAGTRSLAAIIAEDPTTAGVRRMMTTSYALLPAAFAGKLGPFLAGLAQGRLAAVLHCTAGKDRTGFVSALLLTALGVPRDAVFDDYARTDAHADLDRMMGVSAMYVRAIAGAEREPDPAMLRMLCGTSPDYLAAAFAAIDREWGSVDAYLARAADCDGARRDRLRLALLE